jgi:hypothetical protein
MAENETLDLLRKGNRRWRDILDLIAAGQPDGVIEESIKRGLYRTFQKVAKQMPLGPLLRAAIAGDDTADLVRQAEARDYACLVALVVSPGIEVASAAEQVVLAVLDKFLDQMAMEAVGSGAHRDFESFVAARDRWKGGVAGTVHEIAAKIAQNPTASLRMPPTPRAVKEAGRKRMAGMSLLKR